MYSLFVDWRVHVFIICIGEYFFQSLMDWRVFFLNVDHSVSMFTVVSSDTVILCCFIQKLSYWTNISYASSPYIHMN